MILPYRESGKDNVRQSGVSGLPGFVFRISNDCSRQEDPLPQVYPREVVMEKSEKLMKAGKQLAIMHFVEALIARRAAKKRGLKPRKYFCLTLVFGVFVLIPLLRKPKLDKKSKAVDI
jgi:uncharacterized protein YhhL (DUF1145 family)